MSAPNIGTQVTVNGLSELRTALLNLPTKIRDKALQKALIAGDTIIIADAQRRAPQLTGRLQANIYSYKARQSNDDVQVRKITVRSGKGAQKSDRDAFYWVWIEFGHGEITTEKYKVLGNPAKGFFGKTVKAYPAHPFLRPAYDSQKENAVAAFASSLKLQLPPIVADVGLKFA